MDTSLHRQDENLLDLANDQTAGMTGDSGGRKSRNLLIRNYDGFLELISEIAQTAAEYDGHARLLGDARANGPCRVFGAFVKRLGP